MPAHTKKNIESIELAGRGTYLFDGSDCKIIEQVPLSHSHTLEEGGGEGGREEGRKGMSEEGGREGLNIIATQCHSLSPVIPSSWSGRMAPL